MVVIFYVLSFVFFSAGKVESIVFDKQVQELQFWKTSLFCIKSVDRYSMDDIIDVKAYKRGHSGINVYTLHYKVMAIFKQPNTEALTIIETAIEEKCIKQVSKRVFDIIWG